MCKHLYYISSVHLDNYNHFYFYVLKATIKMFHIKLNITQIIILYVKCFENLFYL